MNSFKNDAPFIKVKIIGRIEKELEALLDTGSPNTVIPLSICKELGLTALGIKNVYGIIGKRPLPVFRCKVEIAGQKLNTLILGNENFNSLMFSIVGRDLFRNFELQLDWKKQIIRIKDPPTI
nr:hypothetical protein [Candidatus Sigynarchaeota archaeon]